jgi:hypothetical protein
VKGPISQGCSVWAARREAERRAAERARTLTFICLILTGGGCCLGVEEDAGMDQILYEECLEPSLRG